MRGARVEHVDGIRTKGTFGTKDGHTAVKADHRNYTVKTRSHAWDAEYVPASYSIRRLLRIDVEWRFVARHDDNTFIRNDVLTFSHMRKTHHVAEFVCEAIHCTLLNVRRSRRSCALLSFQLRR